MRSGRVNFEMDENKKCENICECFNCGSAVDCGGTCTNCEECVTREKAKKGCPDYNLNNTEAAN